MALRSRFPRALGAGRIFLLGTLYVASARATEPAPAVQEHPAATVTVNGVRPAPASYAATVQQTASRTDEPLRSVPQSITVIDRQLMDDVGARRTDDVLTLVPGVQTFSGYGGTWDDYTIRGFHVWSNTVYRDGFFAGYSGANAVDAVNVERVEVLRGPGSALYGPGLPGGSINYVMKRPLAERALRGSLTLGSFDTYRADVDATGPITERLRYRLTASADTTSGYRDFNDFRRLLVNPVVEYRLGPRTTMLAEAQAYDVAYRADPAGVPSVNGDPFALPVARSYTEPSLPLASVEGALGRVELTHHFSSAWSMKIATEEKAGRYSEETILTAGLLSDERTLIRPVLNWASSSADAQVQASVHGDVFTGPVEHELMMGTDAGEERVEWRAAGTDPTVDPYPIDLYAPRPGAPLPSVPLPSGSPNSWSYRLLGVYANDVATILPWLRVSAGVRVDSYRQTSYAPPVIDSASDVAVSPRAAILLQPVRPLTFFWNVNQGFWPSLGITADGHVLHAEHSLTYEAGMRTALDRDRVTLDVSVFHLTNRNIAVIDPSNPNFQVQRGEATSDGVEVEATGNVSRHLRVFASYTLTDARVTADPDPSNLGRPLPFAAKHTGAFFARASLRELSKNGPFVGLGGRFTTSRDLIDYTTVPGYARFDGAVGYRLRPALLTFRVENLFDLRYVRGGNNASQILFGAPRSLFISLVVECR